MEVGGVWMVGMVDVDVENIVDITNEHVARTNPKTGSVIQCPSALAILRPVADTHLTLPTIFSV